MRIALVKDTDKWTHCRRIEETIVAEIESDPEKTHAKAVGLARWYREQLFKSLWQLPNIWV